MCIRDRCSSGEKRPLVVLPQSSLKELVDVVTVEGVHFMPEERCIIGKTKAPELVRKLQEHLSL